jgi:hypothetical protein
MTRGYDGKFFAPRNRPIKTEHSTESGRLRLDYHDIVEGAHFGNHVSHIDYERFNPQIRDKDVFIGTRTLEEWAIRDEDESVREVFRVATEKVMSNLLFVDGILHLRCHEPCMVVRWQVPRPWEERTGITIVNVEPGNTSDLAENVDVSSAHERGFAKFGRRQWRSLKDGAQEEAFGYQRCFSPADHEGVEGFAKQLETSARGRAVVCRSDAVLEVLQSDLASADFEFLELGRSARNLIHSTDETRAALTKRQRDMIVEIDVYLAELVTAIIAFDSGDAEPGALETAIDKARQKVARALAAVSVALPGSIDACLGPPHFSRLDTMPIDINTIANGFSLRGL